MDAHPEVKTVFNDVLSMGRKKGYCHRAEENVEIPANLDILFAGFSCKSFSVLNTSRGEASVTNKKQSTGKTLEGVRRYVKAHAPRAMVFENVMGMLQETGAGVSSAADQVVNIFTKMGYKGTYMAVDSRNYLLPQSRHRVWFWFIKLTDEAGDADDKDDQLSACETMKLFYRPEAMPLTGVVGDATSDYVAKERPGDKWIKKHDSFAESNGLKDLMSQELRKKHADETVPKHMSLGARMSSSLVLLKAAQLKKGIDVDLEGWVLQLDQEVERARVCKCFCPCITPGGVYYYGKPGKPKLLTGVDFGALQGVHQADLSKFGMIGIPDNMLRELFGNSFSATVCTFALLALLRDLPF